MPVKVVDASALAAVLFKEPEAPTVLLRLEGAELAAPMLLSFELANIAVIKSRRDPARKADFMTALALRHRVAVNEMEVDQDGVAALALSTGLTAYDATYLWLSRYLGAELVTLDRQLAKVAATPT